MKAISASRILQIAASMLERDIKATKRKIRKSKKEGRLRSVKILQSKLRVLSERLDDID